MGLLAQKDKKEESSDELSMRMVMDLSVDRFLALRNHNARVGLTRCGLGKIN
mgnify:FL=1